MNEKFDFRLFETNNHLQEVRVSYGDSEMSQFLSRTIVSAMFSLNYDKAFAQWNNEDAAFEEIHKYRLTQLYKVLEMINNEGQLKEARKWRSLYAFSWDILTFSNIGIYVDQSYGVKIIPEMEKGFEPLSFQEMSEISFKIELWRHEGIGMAMNYIPRSCRTESQTMNFVLTEEYLRGRVKSSEATLAYISAFLNAQTVNEQLNGLFTIRYNSKDVILDDMRRAAMDLIRSDGGNNVQ